MRDRKLQRSRDQEQRAANTYRGSRVAGSGNGWSAKNDVRANDFLVELKRTDNLKQITIKLADLRALQVNALRSGRIGVLEFDLGGHSYVILPRDDFREYIRGT